MQLLQNCIGPAIRIGRESWCLPYTRFFCITRPILLTALTDFGEKNVGTHKPLVS